MTGFELGSEIIGGSGTVLFHEFSVEASKAK